MRRNSHIWVYATSLMKFLYHAKLGAHTHIHTHAPSRILRTSYQLVALDPTYTTHNKRTGQTSMFSAKFETGMTAYKRLQTPALEYTVTETVNLKCC